MHVDLGNVRLRKPEPSDVDALFELKNDPEVAAMLGGFSKGYTRADLARWVDAHAQARDEALYVIVGDGGRAIGHVGLYEIDHRVRTAEFAILLGDKASWGKGIGLACTKWMLGYGFDELNLHRIHLDVLATNVRAQRLYEKLGLQVEGRLRDAQWKQGRYVDVICMSILENEWRARVE
jgi:RimJ/RimL family protein N-acetyltransferase